MNVFDVLRGMVEHVASRFQGEPKELRRFREDRAYFLGLRERIREARKEKVVLKAALEEAHREVLDPGRARMAKLALMGAFRDPSFWDKTLDKYDAALGKAIQGDEQARSLVELLEGLLKTIQKKGDLLVLEQLRVAIRQSLAKVAARPSRAGTNANLRLLAYEKVEGEIRKVQRLQETAKEISDPEMRLKVYESILRRVTDKRIIPVARLEMLEPHARVIQQWKVTVRDVMQDEFQQGKLELVEEDLMLLLNHCIRRLEQDIEYLKLLQPAYR